MNNIQWTGQLKPKRRKSSIFLQNLHFLPLSSNVEAFSSFPLNFSLNTVLEYPSSREPRTADGKRSVEATKRKNVAAGKKKEKRRREGKGETRRKKFRDNKAPYSSYYSNFPAARSQNSRFLDDISRARRQLLLLLGCSIEKILYLVSGKNKSENPARALDS